MKHETAEHAILAQERSALDQWSQGKPLGYVANVAEDVTYFDDIGAHSRVVGREAVTTYFASLQGKIGNPDPALSHVRARRISADPVESHAGLSFDCRRVAHGPRALVDC